MDFQILLTTRFASILSKPTTVAVVGCSADPNRDSLMIAKLLKSKGFRVIPVNPQLRARGLVQRTGRTLLPRIVRLDSGAG